MKDRKPAYVCCEGAGLFAVTKSAVRVLCALLSMLMPLSLSSCGLLMVESSVKRPYLQPGAKREDVINVLGEPRKTMAFRPPRRGVFIPNSPSSLRSASVARYDEYAVSGLVQLSGDNYASEWNQYGLGFIFTLGTEELITVPVVASDLTYKSLKRYQLRLWYDRSLKLLAYERRKRGILP